MALAADLVAVLDAERVKTHPLDLHVYGKDAGIKRGEPAAIVFPETAADVAAVIAVARRHRVPVVARGAGTGLAGGAVPMDPGIVVVTTRMNRIEEVDVESRTAWVGPGVINLDLSHEVARHGVYFAPDPSSQQTCTIGGNAATNAGGLHCLAEGTTVAHILGLEVVTADGDVVTVGGAAPDPVGLDLRAILVGSEGTLGIITRVLVRLSEAPPDDRTVLLAFATIEDAAATVSGIIAAGLVPAALEMMDRVTVENVENFVHAGFPTDAAAVLLCEIEGHPAAVEAEVEIVAGIAAEHHATEVRIGWEQDERDLWWKGRKSAFGAVAQRAPDYYLHDTVVPRTRLVEVLTKVYEIGERYGLEMMNVFHAGDGNLHPLIAFDAADPEARAAVEAAAREIVEVSVAAGGALSGEHGIGVEKRDLMPLVFGPVDLDAQARLGEAFDPDGVLNPGKVLPVGSRCVDYGRMPA